MNEKVQINIEVEGCSPDVEFFIYLALQERIDEIMEFLEFKKGSSKLIKGKH